MHEISCSTLTLRVNARGQAVSLVHRESGYNFLKDQRHPVGLWEIGLIRPVSYDDPLPDVEYPAMEAYAGRSAWANRHEYLADLLLDSDAAPAPFINGDADGVSLAWSVPVPGGVAAVTLRITGGDDRDELSFGLSVVLPESWGLKRASYPRLRGLGDYDAPGDDRLLYPENWGVLRHNPLEDMTDFAGQYPGSSNWCQMAAWLHGEQGLYLGVLDPDSHNTGIDMQYAEGGCPAPWVHFWEMEMPELAPRPPLAERMATEPSMQLRVNHWPTMAAAWTCPYPVVLRGFTGDWYDAGLIHREWATAQRWCRRGLLAERADASETLASLDLWFIKYAFPAWSMESQAQWNFQQAMHRLLDFFGEPFGVHWYHWHDFSWHSHYPTHFPVAEGFAAVKNELQARGVVIMPYCQGRLLYRDRPTFEVDRAHATYEANGQPYLEKYTDQDDWPLALCPADPWAQMQWIETARALWRQYDVDGVYFDQITAMPPSLCYHAGHGHPLGGGNWYWQGYDAALAAMEPCKAEDPDRFLSSELLSDAFMDRIDLYLAFVPPVEDYVPLHAAIYSGYTTIMGRSTPESVMADLQRFVICQGEQFLFGGQVGWMDDAILKYPDAAACLRDLARLRAKVRAFLHYGVMRRPPAMTVSGDPLAFTVPEAECSKPRPVAVARPAVRHTLWQGPDGAYLLLLLNEATDDREVTFSLPAGLPTGAWTRHVQGGDDADTVAMRGTVTLTIPALTAVALVSNPA